MVISPSHSLRTKDPHAGSDFTNYLSLVYSRHSELSDKDTTDGDRVIVVILVIVIVLVMVVLLK